MSQLSVLIWLSLRSTVAVAQIINDLDGVGVSSPPPHRHLTAANTADRKRQKKSRHYLSVKMVTLYKEYTRADIQLISRTSLLTTFTHFTVTLFGQKV